MSFPPVLPAIGIFGANITVFDRVKGALVGGRQQWTTGADRIIFGIIQPPSPKVLSRLPEGYRTRTQRTIHTSEQLSVGGDGGDRTHARDSGKVFTIFAEAEWSKPGFRRYLLEDYQER